MVEGPFRVRAYPLRYVPTVIKEYDRVSLTEAAPVHGRHAPAYDRGGKDGEDALLRRVCFDFDRLIRPLVVSNILPNFPNR